jgi:threonine/homoserine/homoserine lactone efflux protein
MTIQIFFQGFLLGLSIAAPVGPIGVLCIRRTLAAGKAAGFVSGIGAATADAFYGSIAAFSLAFLSRFLIDQQAFLQVSGGIFLVYLGVRTFRARPSETPAAATASSLPGMFASTFFLTLTNPMTILSFTAIFAGLGLGNLATGRFSAAWMVTGVFTGSAAWWLLLSSGVSLLRSRFNHQAMRWVNRASGSIITAFGIAILLQRLWAHLS